MQLGTAYDNRRVVLSAGKFTILDFFDRNAFGIDPRQRLLSLSFMTYGAWDFAADARGYAWGAVGELYWDDWSVRAARITPPKEPNQLPVDFRLGRFYGDQMELAHKHHIFGQEGAARVDVFRNREVIGNFNDAVAVFEADPQKNATTCTTFNYGSQNANAPDLCWVRKPQTKKGIGLFAEQYVAKDMGVFTRAMYSDGKTEVFSYTAADRTASLGFLAKGVVLEPAGRCCGYRRQSWLDLGRACAISTQGRHRRLYRRRLYPCRNRSRIRPFLQRKLCEGSVVDR